MFLQTPPSSHIPNIHKGIGLSDAKAVGVVSNPTREHLRQQGIQLHEPLGTPGAFGIVMAATDAMQRRLAVKIVSQAADGESRKRHQRECMVFSVGAIPEGLGPRCYSAYKVAAPNDAEIHADIADGVQPYLVMSRIEGLELHAYIQGQLLPISQRIELVMRLFDALKRLHQCGIVHGDISPRNLLIEPGAQVRFIDFGGAREIHESLRAIPPTTALGGTPGYAPFTQLTGEQQASIATDLRAMSAVAYDTLSGQLHDEQLKPSEKLKKLKKIGIPAALAKIVLRGLQASDNNPFSTSDAFASAEEILTAIRKWQTRQTRIKQAWVFVPVLAVACVLLTMAWRLFEAPESNSPQQLSTGIEKKKKPLIHLLPPDSPEAAFKPMELPTQKIFKEEVFDTRDWEATNQPLADAINRHRELVRNRDIRWEQFIEAISILRQMDVEISDHEFVVRKALKQRDEAYHQKFLALEGLLAAKRAERQKLIEKKGQLTASAPVAEIDRQIASLISQQANYLNGYERTIGKQSIDLKKLMNSGFIPSGKSACESSYAQNHHQHSTWEDSGRFHRHR
ncbi:MAG: protein kinase domain-containing protein [Planctomycetota bacterium]